MTSINSEALIKVENLNHIYSTRTGKVKALDSISFEVKKGEFFIILGPSGCGKSTLLKVISGLLSPTEGEVSVAGKRVEQPLENIGMVFQTPILLKWCTVLQNVLLPVNALGLPVKDYMDKAMELLKLVGLNGFENKYPRELSGGMQQRVSIARALILDPDLLLMDEPFGALDAITRDEMNFELLRIWQEKQKTIVFITHGINEAVLMADSVLVMTQRPARIAKIIPIDLERPRTVETRASKAFGEYVVDIYKMMGLAR